jgi:hypothetical protein
MRVLVTDGAERVPMTDPSIEALLEYAPICGRMCCCRFRT